MTPSQVLGDDSFYVHHREVILTSSSSSVKTFPTDRERFIRVCRKSQSNRFALTQQPSTVFVIQNQKRFVQEVNTRVKGINIQLDFRDSARGKSGARNRIYTLIHSYVNGLAIDFRI
jgi:hypothetical protein